MRATEIFAVHLLFVYLRVLFVHSGIVLLNPKFPLQEPTFPLTSWPHLWPQPSEWVTSPVRYQLEASTSIRTSRKLRHCDIILHNVDKYTSIIRNLIHSSTTGNRPYPAEETVEPFLKEIYLFVDNSNCSSTLYPQYGPDYAEDESYSIEVQAKSGKAILYAGSVWGAIRALETFSQLMYVDRKTTNLKKQIEGPCHQWTAVYVNVSRVQDQPRFKYRGLLIDTARHFIATKLIIKNLDAMSYSKFNTLHWHLNDDQAFPFASRKFTNFSRLAGYSPYHVYHYQDIELIVEEARLRGIQVILEIDTPGHGTAFGKVFPDLLTTCVPLGVNRKAAKSENLGNTLDASKESTYETLGLLLEELTKLFPSKLIHLGMDDVNYDCWNSNPSVREFMSSRRMYTTALLEEYYGQRLIKMANDLGRSAIVWQDPMDEGVRLASETIVQVWKDAHLLSDYAQWPHYMQRMVKLNYSTILSSCWFLSMIRYGQDWRDFYNCDPHDFDATEEEKKLVLGGEACLWGEYVDGSNFMSRLWPRAAAVGERLWSEHTDQLLNDVQYRLDAQRCRLLSRGIAASPLQTGFCAHFDWNSNQSLDEELNLPDPLEPTGEPMNQANFSNSGQFQSGVNFDYQSSKRSPFAEADVKTPMNRQASSSPIGAVAECVTKPPTINFSISSTQNSPHSDQTPFSSFQSGEQLDQIKSQTEIQVNKDPKTNVTTSNNESRMEEQSEINKASTSSLNWKWGLDDWNYGFNSVETVNSKRWNILLAILLGIVVFH